MCCKAMNFSMFDIGIFSSIVVFDWMDDNFGLVFIRQAKYIVVKKFQEQINNDSNNLFFTWKHNNRMLTTIY